MIKDDCIFCKLANGIFATTTVYEDDTFRAIMDIAPAAKGHILILPKEHMADITEITPDVAAKALTLASKIATAQKKALGCDGVNMLQNTGTAAWQTVFHLHIHLIPRYENDNLVMPWEHLSYADGEAEEIAQKISNCIK